ncbi:MAG: putative toxin-antitoxin system toxin component, PIN family [Saprospiraceae bacterium]
MANEQIVILADAELLAELKEVCTRPKFSLFLSPEQIADFLKIISDRLTIVESTSIVEVCLDPNDDYLLAICLDSAADFLLTGDKDLLSLRTFKNTRILTITKFEEL